MKDDGIKKDGALEDRGVGKGQDGGGLGGVGINVEHAHA